MGAPKVESSNTRFFILFTLGAVALVGWYAWRSIDGEFQLPAWNIEVPVSLIVFGVIMTLSVLGSVSKYRRSERAASDDPIDTHYDAIEETFRREKNVDAIGELPDWEHMTPRQRAQILSWVAIAISFIIGFIGSIIGLIMLRNYSHEDSVMVTIARVILVLGILIPILLFVPIVLLAANP